jgi:hypothetical protein
VLRGKEEEGWGVGGREIKLPEKEKGQSENTCWDGDGDTDNVGTSRYIFGTIWNTRSTARMLLLQDVEVVLRDKILVH